MDLSKRILDALNQDIRVFLEDVTEDASHFRIAPCQASNQLFAGRVAFRKSL